MAKVNYIVLHSAVDLYLQGSVIPGDTPGLDFDRLLDVGAVRKATTEESKVADEADDPQLARGAPVSADVAAERLDKAQPTDEEVSKGKK